MTLRQQASRRLRKLDSFVALRRLQHEGWTNAWRRWQQWCRVLELPPIQTDPISSHAKVEVHLVCCQRDYLCALWALKSFYVSAGVSCPLVVHLNGRMSAIAMRRLREHLPNARLVGQETADEAVAGWLEANRCTRLRDLRAHNGFMLKLVDVNLLAQASTILLLDSDVIFFRRPDELLTAMHEPIAAPLFQRDAGTTYNVTLDEALSDLGIRLVPSVNTGIVLFEREMMQLQRCEELLQHPRVARPSGWIEQTLYALVASEGGDVRFLPAEYLVSLEPRADLSTVVARHYAGPSRPFLTEEGVPLAYERLAAARRTIAPRYAWQ
jgi:hypothetical protein